ncbi:MAG: hypothetical protein ACYC2U_08795, partial [Candidatus Amoebophilus sp.]
IVINRGGGKMFGDAGDLQNLTSKELGVPLNTTNANIIVNQMLSPEQKRYVELLVERYNKVISPKFKEEYSKATGKAMPEYGMYLPALRYIREPKNKEEGKSSLGSFDIGGVGLGQDGRLKDKVENANAPLIIKDFFALMAETVQFSANYIAFRKALQDLDNVVNNKNIQTALDGIPGYGKGMRESLEQFEKRITGKTLMNITGLIDRYDWSSVSLAEQFCRNHSLTIPMYKITRILIKVCKVIVIFICILIFFLWLSIWESRL